MDATSCPKPVLNVDESKLSTLAEHKHQSCYNFPGLVGCYVHSNTGKHYAAIGGFRWTSNQMGGYREYLYLISADDATALVAIINNEDDDADGFLGIPDRARRLLGIA